jgi:hypothetical protein
MCTGMYQGKVNYSPEEVANSRPGHKNYVQVSYTGLKWKLKGGKTYMIT